jgi:hypothetical protein
MGGGFIFRLQRRTSWVTSLRNCGRSKIPTITHPDDQALALSSIDEHDSRVKALTVTYRLRHKLGREGLGLSTPPQTSARPATAPLEFVSVGQRRHRAAPVGGVSYASQKMAQWSAHGGIAHDFNNILLTVILGNATILTEDPTEASSRHACAPDPRYVDRRGSNLNQKLLASDGVSHSTHRCSASQALCER